MKSNYHTHNYRCNHADGNIEEYVIEAIKAGFDEVGFSDHLPHPGKNIDNTYRMRYEEVSEYMKEIDEAIEKYGEKISIKKGIECEYFAEYGWLYEELIEKHKAEYLLLGVHFFPYKGDWLYVGEIYSDSQKLESYSDYVVESMKSGLFKYIAHPDIFGMSYINWDDNAIKASRKILQAAEDLNMPIEINVNGLRKPLLTYNKGKRHKYPVEDFWQLSKEYNVRTIIGIDAHYPREMHDLDMGLEFAQKFGIEVMDRLKF